jgi:hypothetical protein
VGSAIIDLTNTSTDEASVAAETATDPPDQKEENQALPTEGLFLLTDSPLITPKDVRKTASSPTLAQIHSTLSLKMVELSMSAIEEPPPGAAPDLVPTGESLLNTKLAMQCNATQRFTKCYVN